MIININNVVLYDGKAYQFLRSFASETSVEQQMQSNNYFNYFTVIKDFTS